MKQQGASDRLTPADSTAIQYCKACIQTSQFLLIFFSDCTITNFGFNARDRSTLDAATVFTMVSEATFPSDGAVRAVELYSGAANRPLSVGIYRPIENQQCSYILVQQRKFDSFDVGRTSVS